MPAVSVNILTMVRVASRTLQGATPSVTYGEVSNSLERQGEHKETAPETSSEGVLGRVSAVRGRKNTRQAGEQ